MLPLRSCLAETRFGVAPNLYMNPSQYNYSENHTLIRRCLSHSRRAFHCLIVRNLFVGSFGYHFHDTKKLRPRVPDSWPDLICRALNITCWAENHAAAHIKASDIFVKQQL